MAKKTSNKAKNQSLKNTRRKPIRAKTKKPIVVAAVDRGSLDEKTLSLTSFGRSQWPTIQPRD